MRPKNRCPTRLQRFFQSQVKEFSGAEDKKIQNQLQNLIYLYRFGHTEALHFRKKGHKTDIFPVLQKLTHM